MPARERQPVAVHVGVARPVVEPVQRPHSGAADRRIRRKRDVIQVAVVVPVPWVERRLHGVDERTLHRRAFGAVARDVVVVVPGGTAGDVELRAGLDFDRAVRRAAEKGVCAVRGVGSVVVALLHEALFDNGGDGALDLLRIGVRPSRAIAAVDLQHRHLAAAGLPHRHVRATRD